MRKNNLRLLREKLGHTQSSLAEKTGLSLRTIQRIEAGDTIPKGHTLNVLANALNVDTSELRESDHPQERTDSESKTKIAMINLSALCFMGIPFGNIIVPMILWNRNRDTPFVDQVGRKIINFQIIWSLIVSILLIITPFLQKGLSLSFPLMLIAGLVSAGANLFVICRTAMSINRNNLTFLNLRLQFL